MKQPSILIVDDDQDVVSLLSMRCQAMGWETHCCTSMGQAYQALLYNPSDVVILDQQLPDGTGLELSQLIRDTDDLNGIPVILLTGQRDYQIMQACHDQCAYYVLKNSEIWQRIEPLLMDLLANQLIHR